MTQASFFLPLILQILLTMLLYIALAVAKSRAASAGQVNLERRALHADAWPDSVIKINNNIRNQFEVPVLFFVITIILWLINETGVLVQGLAWLFVISRYAHSYVHTGANNVLVRRRVFMLGTVVVIVMTLIALSAILRSMFSV